MDRGLRGLLHGKISKMRSIPKLKQVKLKPKVVIVYQL